MQPNAEESKKLVGEICEYKEGPIHAIVEIIEQQQRGQLMHAKLQILARAHRRPIPALDLDATFTVSWTPAGSWNQVFRLKLLKAYDEYDAIDIVNRNRQRKVKWATTKGTRI